MKNTNSEQGDLQTLQTLLLIAKNFKIYSKNVFKFNQMIFIFLMDVKLYVQDNISKEQKQINININSGKTQMRFLNQYQLINSIQIVNIRKVKNMEIGLKQEKISLKDVKQFIMEIIIMEQNVINGTFYTESIQVKNEQLQEEEIMIIKDKKQEYGDAQIKKFLKSLIGKYYIKM
ncbi:unnamed protein product [Paramecium sonneborni]|uniref:Uncharacterized protein n=1 Tax=Paramecium sonneborni TaxID=65129 RepID=A0A8S1RBI8_9CILI|nr:unnamed protein product [Paramecium sonneborni]